ncbi:hypothetical protein LWI29_031439 [Acer saccharum]|uniref:Chromo domain-containing protein n=1 Tax=Acer saccharum TaxID=4024 RepID=A0AA39WB70_ACESA|nr:hypothetical protein LWI29_031439 [Acer saccharum]
MAANTRGSQAIRDEFASSMAAMEKRLISRFKHQLGDVKGNMDDVNGKVTSLDNRSDSGSGHRNRERTGDRSGERDRYDNRDPYLKNVKIDLLKFCSGDPEPWARKALQYFELYKIPVEARVKVAQFSFEEKAAEWFQDIRETEIADSWETFYPALKARFAPAIIHSYFGQLCKLKQNGTVEALRSEFEQLANKVPNLIPDLKLDCFLSCLKEELQIPVKMLKPSTTFEAYELAKQQEAYLSIVTGKTFTIRGNKVGSAYTSSWGTKNNTFRETSSSPKESQYSSIVNSGTGSTTSVNSPQVSRISRKEIEERKRKGLCFSCDEKWNLGHKCKTPKLFYIEAEYDEVEVEPPDGEISLNAITGSQTPNTMRLEGYIGKHRLVILVDSGSTHNFVDSNLIKKCGLRAENGRVLQVKVANGELLKSEGYCAQTPIRIQTFQTMVDLFALPLGGCDIVLGVSWLKSLGPILWDLNALTLQFQWERKTIQLTGIQAPIDQLFQIEDNFLKMHKGLFLQISMQPAEVEQQRPVWVQEVLDEFLDVFKEPSELPPFRCLDHQITLKEGSSPVSVLERIGAVAYKLDLPASSRVHPVFHVSLLKKKLGAAIIPIPGLPPTNDKGQFYPEPEQILQHRMKKVNNRAITEVLIKWCGQTDKEATWEILHQMSEAYPYLVGKVL